MRYDFTHQNAKETIRLIRNHIQNYFLENGLRYAIFGKSEGLDSSVIAGLLSGIDGVRPIAVTMPCESGLETERLAKIVLDHFKISSIQVDLTREFHSLMGHYYSLESVHGQLSNILMNYGDHTLLKSLPHKKSRAAGNIKARLRMITLYHIAQLTGGIVISTDNLSEFWMGFWTINGDVGDLAPIQYLWKGLEEQVIAEVLGVPKEAILVTPTDGLDVIPGGTDEDQLGLPYSDLDQVIITLLQKKFDGKIKQDEGEILKLSNNLSEKLGYPSDKIAHVARQMMSTNYKRNWPVSFNRLKIGLPDIEYITV